MSLAVRTMTALCTSPFFTLPRGAASLTETTMMSPTPARRRLEPPSTLMHWTRLAPLLSATSRLDCIWIIDPTSFHFNRAPPGDQFNSLRGDTEDSGGRLGRRLLRSGVNVYTSDHFPGLQL